MCLVNKLPLLFVLTLLSGCASFFSGDTPLPVQESDRVIAKNANLQLSGLPLITKGFPGQSIKIYVVAFDGTENDRAQINKDVERETIVATLATRLAQGQYDVDYVIGPGVGSKADAAICYSCETKAKAALLRLQAKVQQDWGENPLTEIRVLVIGFSRGAAIGRHFMNLVSELWPASDTFPGRPTAKSVTTTGLLFDTVATGQEQNLSLGISPTTDHLLHLIARDERRDLLFKVVVDVDRDFPLLRYAETRKSSRITEITLPGAHSDIGASYLSGMGGIYRMLAEQSLVELGLSDQLEWSLDGSVFNDGVHDSRGILDVLIGAPSYFEAPDQERKTVPAQSSALTIQQRETLSARLEILKEAKWIDNNFFRQSIVTIKGITETAKLSLTKQGEKLNVKAISPWILQETIRLDQTDTERILIFGGLGPDHKLAMSKLRLSDKVWAALPDNMESILEVIIHRPKDKNLIRVLVNRKEIEVLGDDNARHNSD